MDQIVKLKIDGDVSGLLASVKSAMAEMDREAKKMRLSPDAARAIPKGLDPGTTSFLKGNQQAHAQLQNQKNEENNLRAVNQLLTKTTREYEAISKSIKARAQQEKDVTGQIAQQEKLLKNIEGLEKQRENLKESAARRAKSEVRTYSDLLSNMQKGLIEGGMPGLKGAWGGMSGPEKMGFGATSIGGILGAMGVAANYVGQRPIDIARMQSSAISMTTGRQLREARSGEYTYESMYGDDRKKSQEQASSSNKWKTAGDIATMAASVAALIAVPFTGGLSGLGLAAAGGFGLKSSFLDKGMADPEKYGAYQAQREAQDFTALLAASHEMGPYRKDAIERLKATGGRDLGMERTLGLKDFGSAKGIGGYLGAGGYLRSQMDLGFTDEMVTSASQGILGAGGSTAMARQSGTALQAQRGLGLTNANELLGQISGTQSIPETSRKTLIDIFARGFDSSRYAEENRKYMQAVTEQVYKGGSTSEATASSIADLIRASVGTNAPTSRNIEASKSAYESYKATGSATSGYAGGVNLADAMNDPWLKNSKDPAELTEIMKEGMDIDENDPDIIEFANRKGMPSGGAKAFAAAMRKRIQNTNERQLNRPKGTSSGLARRGMAGTIDSSLDTAGRRARANMGNVEDMPADLAADARAVAEAAMRSEKTGKAGDTSVQASAKNAQISLETLSASINKFASDAMSAANKLAGEAPGGRAHEADVAAAAAAHKTGYDYASEEKVWDAVTGTMSRLSDIAARKARASATNKPPQPTAAGNTTPGG